MYSAASVLSASAAANPTKHNNPLPMDETTSPSTWVPASPFYNMLVCRALRSARWPKLLMSYLNCG